MVRSPEEQIEEEIKKAADWYGNKYKKTFQVRRRYDKQEKHWSWQIVAEIGGQERGMSFGMSLAMSESPQFPLMKAHLYDYIKQTLIKAQVKWEPHILALK